MARDSTAIAKRIVWMVLKYGVVIASFAYLLGTDKIHVHDLLRAANSPLYLLLCLTILLFSLLISFVRYQILLAAVDIHIRMMDNFRYGFIAFFFNTLMPGGVGGDVIKMAYLMKNRPEKERVLAATSADRFAGLITMVAICAISLLFGMEKVQSSPGLSKLAVMIAGIFGTTLLTGVVGLLTIFYNRKAGFAGWCFFLLFVLMYMLAPQGFPLKQSLVSSINEVSGNTVIMQMSVVLAFAASLSIIYIIPSCQPGRRLDLFFRDKIPFGHIVINLMQSLLLYARTPWVLFSACGLSLFANSLYVLSVFCAARAIHLPQHPGLGDVFFALPPTFLANSLPLPGGGIGFGEMIFDSILSLCQTPEGLFLTGGATILLTWRFVLILLSSFGFIVYLFQK